MALDFITSNPAEEGYDVAERRMTRLAKQRNEIGVDEAIRGGVTDMLGAQQRQPAEEAPAPAQAASTYKTPSTSTGGLTDRIIGSESSGNPTARNPRSSATGAAQFIDSTWLDYARANPDRFQGKSQEQILASRNDQALSRHATDWYASQNRPLLSAAGHDPSDTNTGMAHRFGPQDAIKILNAHKENASVPISQVVSAEVMAANPHLQGQTVGDVVGSAGKSFGGIQDFAGSAQYAAPPGVRPNGHPGEPGYSVPRATFMPAASSGGGTRFDPILSRLAGQPGGGATAIKLLEAQGRFDQQNWQRTNQASKLALYALGKGDVQTARFYMEQAGIPTQGNAILAPGANPAAVQAFGKIGTITANIYGHGTPEGQKFAQVALQTYLQNGGNAAQALQDGFAQAGPPRNKPQVTIRQVFEQGGNSGFISIDRNTGTAASVTMNGAAVSSAPPPARPGQPSVDLKVIPQADGTSKAYVFDNRGGGMKPAVDSSTQQPVVGAARKPAGVLTFDHKVQALRASGMTAPGEAEAAAMGHFPPTLSQPVIVNAYKSFSKALDDAAIMEGPLSPEDRTARLNARMDELFQGLNWRGIITGGRSAPAPVSAPSGPAPTPAPASAQQPREWWETGSAPQAPAATPPPAQQPAPAASPPVNPATAPRGTTPQTAIPITDPSQIEALPKLPGGTWFVPPDGIPRKTKPIAPSAPMN